MADGGDESLRTIMIDEHAALFPDISLLGLVSCIAIFVK